MNQKSNSQSEARRLANDLAAELSAHFSSKERVSVVLYSRVETAQPEREDYSLSLKNASGRDINLGHISFRHYKGRTQALINQKHPAVLECAVRLVMEQNYKIDTIQIHGRNLDNFRTLKG